MLGWPQVCCSGSGLWLHQVGEPIASGGDCRVGEWEPWMELLRWKLGIVEGITVVTRRFGVVVFKLQACQSLGLTERG